MFLAMNCDLRQDTLDEAFFKYKMFVFDSVRLVKKLLDGKADCVKYMLIGSVGCEIEIELVKSYWSGKLVVNSPHHVKFMAERVKEIYGETL